MNRTPVQSSNMAEVGYDAPSMTLEIQFIKSGTYHFFDVPELVYVELMQADSKGKYFNSNIRNNYRNTRL